MRPIKYVFLLILGSMLTVLEVEPNNPCIDNDIVPIIENFEGWEEKVYKDIVNINTIGYGFTEGFLKRWGLVFNDIDKDLGNSIVLDYCYKVNANILDSTYLNKHQRKAVFSFIYNIGESKYKKSTLHKIATNRIMTNIEVCNELKKYVYAGGKISKGLQNRRQNECNLMEKY